MNTECATVVKALKNLPPKILSPRRACVIPSIFQLFTSFKIICRFQFHYTLFLISWCNSLRDFLSLPPSPSVMFGISYSSDPEQMGSLTSQMTEISSKKDMFMTWDRVISRPYYWKIYIVVGIESTNLHLTPWEPL